MRSSTRNLLWVLAVALGTLIGCGKGADVVTPTPVAGQSCSAAAVSGLIICVDGNGNVITVNPAPTPQPSSSPAGGTPLCEKRDSHAYEGNVVQALSRVPTGQAMEAHIASLAARLKEDGFQVEVYKAGAPGSLSRDELALKAGNSLSETYDVWQGDFVTGLPQVLYVQTCSPARF